MKNTYNVLRVNKFLHLTEGMGLIECLWWMKNTLPKYKFNAFKWIDTEYFHLLKFEQYINQLEEQYIEPKDTFIDTTL